jgi:hypothetical protein
MIIGPATPEVHHVPPAIHAPLEPHGWPHDAAPDNDLLLCAEAEVERLTSALAAALAERDELARLATDLAGQLGAAEARIETLESLGPDDFMPRITQAEWARRSLPHAARGIDAETHAELSAYYDSIRSGGFDDDERGSGQCFDGADDAHAEAMGRAIGRGEPWTL